MAHGHCTMQRCHLIMALVHVDAFLPNKKRSKNDSSWASSRTINESDHPKKYTEFAENWPYPVFLCCLDLVNFKPQVVPGKHLLQIHDYSLHGKLLGCSPWNACELLTIPRAIAVVLQNFPWKPPSFHPLPCKHCGCSIAMLDCQEVAKCWGPCWTVGGPRRAVECLLHHFDVLHGVGVAKPTKDPRKVCWTFDDIQMARKKCVWYFFHYHNSLFIAFHN